ncbi:hypothetical protein [uncultured Campylobacter sp.]|uniref:hypothetical protein n=1 Tax=uncultured Campylobacter sp. TaxID=218934 RepID=UPI003211B290
MEKPVLDERTLPLDIQERIRDLLECESKNDTLHLDIYWGELYGFINASQHGGEISKELADFLREKYLGI